MVGRSYSVTEETALKEAEKPGCGFLSPYDHPEVWYVMLQQFSPNMKDMIMCIVTISSA
jgi:hypothetical protein